MAAPAPFGSQFLVNVATSGGEDSPSVAALANGNFVVAWEDNAAGFSNDGQYRVYHADGMPLTGALPLNISLDGNQGRPVVAALTNGDFVVAWRDDASGNFDLKARIYHDDGSPAGDEFLVNNLTAGVQQEPAIAALAGGGFVVTWTRPGSAGDLDIGARTFDASGAPRGDEFLAATLATNETQSAVAGLSNGNYVIAFTSLNHSSSDKSGSHIGASIFSDNGTLVGTRNFLVNTTFVDGDQSEPSIAVLSNGNFLVAWSTPIGGAYDIDGKVYSATGADLSGAEFGLSSRGGINETQASLAAANGQLFLTWTDFGAVAGDGSGLHIGASVWSNNFIDTSGPFVADRTFVTGDQSESTIAGLSDGRMIIVWTDSGLSPGAPDPVPNAVYGQIFDPRTAAVSLAGHGLLDDEWVGTRFNDAMDGFGGNDHINGAAGNDNLFGGIGNDALIGGLGVDAMRGGPGNDSYFVDNAGDVVDESVAGSSGIDRVFSTITFNLANAAHTKGAVENLTLLGLGNLDGTGNSLSNLLTGNAGANALDGEAGADVMRGLGGNDTYVIDNANDVADETGGGGTDRVRSSISFSLADAAHAKGAVENLTLTGDANLNATGNGLANVITGNGGANIISGGLGNDALAGGLGNDTLTGGAGNDFFLFDAAFKPAPNIETITDFAVADDTIELENGLFTKLKKVGVLPDKFFEIGKHAADHNDYLVYNKKTGVLSYDKDGDGHKHGIEIAQLADHLHLTGADFLVI